MYKLFTNIDLVKDNWDQLEMSHFTKFYFLNTFFKHHKNFRHLFFISKNLRLYGQLFKFRIENINHYSNNKLVISLLKLFKINILYLSNSFFTNSPAFFSTKKIDLSKLLSLINDNYFMIVVPDHLMNAVKSESRNNYQKIEVEEDMFLDLDSNWKSFDDYLLNLKAKYRKKI